MGSLYYANVCTALSLVEPIESSHYSELGKKFTLSSFIHLSYKNSCFLVLCLQNIHHLIRKLKLQHFCRSKVESSLPNIWQRCKKERKIRQNAGLHFLPGPVGWTSLRNYCPVKLKSEKSIRKKLKPFSTF